MLALSSARYFLPAWNEDLDVWEVSDVDLVSVTSAQQFNYTVKATNSSGVVERMTFLYDGRSVKPSPRTLRVFGADKTSKIVSVLSKNKHLHLTIGDVVSHIKL